MVYTLAKEHLLNGNLELFKKTIHADPSAELEDDQARELISLALGISDKFPLLQILSLIKSAPDVRRYQTQSPFVYRGCIESPEHAARFGLALSPRTNPVESILEHKRCTGSSIYLSCSKNLEIAREFAISVHIRKSVDTYIYKIVPRVGIDCSLWFKPASEFHEDEEEVLIAHHIPADWLVGYAHPNSPNEFMSMPAI